MTTRLPDAEIDEIIATDPSGLTPTSVAQDLALEVRERRAAEREVTIGSDVERQIRRAAEPLAASVADSGVPWATADELQACPAEKLRYTRESADFVAACSPANVLALLSELAQLRARVGELEGERDSAGEAYRQAIVLIEALNAKLATMSLGSAGDHW